MSKINKIKLSGTTYDVEDANASKTVELTQAQYDALVSGGTVDPNTYYIITDAQAVDLTNYYTKSQTNTLLNGKQATLVSGTNIKTINNESLLGSGNIDIQGGSSYTAGRGIDITNDTISFSLPISAGTGTGSIIANGNSTKATGNQSFAEGYSTSATSQGAHSEGMYTKATGTAAHAEGYSTTAGGYSSHAEGYNTKASSNYSHAEGDSTTASGYYSHAEGSSTTASGQSSHAEGNSTTAGGNYSHAEGNYTSATNRSEHASGQYNVSNKANGTWGNSGNTLFSVGNGTSTSARHNAFEIRQNGDIYLTLNGQDVKLQDQLGGSSITVDTALDSGSTNPVENRVIYNKIDEVEQVTSAALNELNDKIDAIDLSEIEDRLSEDEEVTAAGLNAVNDKFGGLKLQQITQSDYNNLQTKDPSTLYIIAN